MKIWETRIYDDYNEVEKVYFTKKESAISYLVQEYEKDRGASSPCAKEKRQLYNDYIATHNEDTLDKLIRYLDGDYFEIDSIEVIED